MASVLTPNLGTVHEWITSADDTSIRIWVLNGMIVRLFTSRSRNSELFNSFLGIMKESNWILLKFDYSYDQYHWCPIVLIVIEGLLISSIKYNNRNDGKAIKIKIIPGMIVQMISMFCDSNKNLLIILLL